MVWLHQSLFSDALNISEKMPKREGERERERETLYHSSTLAY